jgi:hypothetical protein
VSEEEQEGLTPNEHYAGSHRPPLFPRNKRFLFSSPSLQRASHDPGTSPSGASQQGFYDYPTGRHHAPPPISPDNTPATLPRTLFKDLPRPVLIGIWLAPLVIAVIVVFVAVSAGGHGRSHNQNANSSPNSGSSSAPQGITAITTGGTTAGTQPSTGTPGGSAPTSLPGNAPPPTKPVAAPTPTHVVAPTATIDPSTCTFSMLSSPVAKQSSNGITVTAYLYWDTNSAGKWCGEFEINVSVISSNLISGTLTGTLTYKVGNGSYTTMTGTQAESNRRFWSTMVGPVRATCASPGGSFGDVTATTSNFCP